MEHVKRLVLVPEHMVDQRKKPLVPPLTAQVQEIDSDMQDIMQRQDIPIDAQAKMYDQNLQRYLTFYDKRMNKPLRVNVIKPAVPEEEEKPQGEQIEEKPDEIETDILDSVPATMKSRTRQLIKKLKANKDIIGWNEQGQMVFKGTTIPGTNIVDLVNDSLVVLYHTIKTTFTRVTLARVDPTRAWGRWTSGMTSNRTLPRACTTCNPNLCGFHARSHHAWTS